MTSRCGMHSTLRLSADNGATGNNLPSGWVLINGVIGDWEAWEILDWELVVGEGAAPSRHADLAFTGVYKTPLHGWCYPPFGRVL